MYDSVVIYNSNSKYQEKVTAGFKKIDDIKAIHWDSDVAQSFLENQFGWTPKTLVVIDEDTVYVGKYATEHLTNRQGVPSILSEFTKSRAEPFSTIASKVLNFTEDNDEIHGKFPIKNEAEDDVKNLLSGTNIEIE
jgi:hypothetical protein